MDQQETEVRPKTTTAHQRRLNKLRQRRWRENREEESPVFEQWDTNLAALHVADEPRYTALMALDRECRDLNHRIILCITGQDRQPGQLLADVSSFVERTGLKKLLGEERQHDPYALYGLQTQLGDTWYANFTKYIDANTDATPAVEAKFNSIGEKK
jgi:hypothetical protein